MAAAATRAAVPGRVDAEALIRSYRRAGDRRVLEKIVQMHEGLLTYLARQHASISDESCEDLIQVAHVAPGSTS